MTDIIRLTGLGFDISRMDPSDFAEFPCDFHKLGEEVSPMPCPEEPFIFVSLSGIEEGLSMCRKHFARFVFDMLDVLEVFKVEDTDLPPEEEDGKMVKADQAITKSAFYETFMRIKREMQGAN